MSAISPMDLLDQAKAAMKARDRQQAIQYILEGWDVVRSGSEYAHMMSQFVSVAATLLRKQLKEYDLALDMLSVAHQVYHVETFKLRVELAIVLNRKKKYEQALEMLQQLHTEWPDRADVLDQMGIALEKMERYEEARMMYERQLERDPDNKYGQAGRQRIIAILDQQVRKQQQELEASRNLRDLGLMATGVAHELNQPIGIIRAIVSRERSNLRDNLFQPERVPEVLEKIWAQTERLNVIVKRFRERAKVDRANRAIVNLNAVIHMAIQTTFEEQLRNRGIALTLDLWADEPPPEAFANPYELEEVLINLVANARDALDERRDGQITIRTARRPDGSARISVEDNGPGLSDDYKQHMFVPFFSTKASGIGVGLYLSRDIVVTLGGKLYYDDSYTEGARFIIELPPIDAQTRESAPIWTETIAF